MWAHKSGSVRGSGEQSPAPTQPQQRRLTTAGSSTRPRELRWSHVTQRTVGTILVVSNPPGRPQCLSGLHIIKDFAAKHLVPQPTVETFCVTIFPGTAGRNIQRADIRMSEPLTKPGRDELRAIVRPDVIRNPMSNKQSTQHVHNIVMPNSARHFQSQTLPSVFVDNRQPLQGRTRTRAVEDEIPCPDVVSSFGTMPNAALITVTQTTLLLRFASHFQTLTTPKPIRSIKANAMPFTLQQLRDPTIPKPWMLTNQFQHPCNHTRLIVRSLRFISLRTAMLRRHRTCPPFTHDKL
jgi:hypothetical protein